MAIPILLNDVILVQLNAHANDQLGLMGCHFRATNKVATGASLEDFAAAVDAACGTKLIACMANDADYRWTQVIRIKPVRSVTVINNANTGSGTAGTQLLPTQTCGLVGKLTPFAGRKNRGRCYVPFPAEDDNAATGTPTVGYATRLGLLANEFIKTYTVSDGIGGSWDLIPVLMNESTGLTIDVTSHILRQKWATQRRRGAFGRPNP